MASAGNVFDTAMRVISSVTRPDRAAASEMRLWICSRFAAIEIIDSPSNVAVCPLRE